MESNYFYFNGRRSTDYGLYLLSAPDIPWPAGQAERVEVPGRNGSLRIGYGAYKNVSITYDCFFAGNPAQASEIAGWLYSSDSYIELRDSYNPDVFRLAVFDGGGTVRNILNQLERVQITFDCKPQLWTDAGQQPISYLIPAAPYDYFDLREMGELYNPYPFTATPLILLDGSADVTLTVSNDLGEQTLLCTTSYYTTVDCEMHNMTGAYQRGDVAANLNSQLRINTDFPVLAPGRNIIRLSRKAAAIAPTDAPAAGLQIIPRWWHL